MQKLIGSCAGIIAFAMIAACSGHRETTTVHRESVQTAPAAPAVIEKRTTTESGGALVERRTTETRETDD